MTARTDAIRPVDRIDALVRWPEPGSEADGFVRLNRNERLAPHPEWFVERIRARVTSDLLTEYPVAEEVYAALAARDRVAVSELLLTPGSDAAVKAAYHAYVAPGDRVVMLEPSYAMYPVYAEMFGADPVRVAFDDVSGIDPERLVAAIDDTTKLVLVTNPNQPTGTLMCEEGLLAVARRAAEVGALVLVDEAYFDFAGVTVVPRIREHANLLVTRTFSKGAGLAGLRIGYVAAHERVVQALFKVRSVHDVNAFAMGCATEILANPSIVGDYVADVRASATLLSERAASIGLEVPPTHTNFALVRVAHRCEPAALVERLRERGYLVRGPFSIPVLADFIRVTLGPPALIDRFCDALADALA